MSYIDVTAYCSRCKKHLLRDQFNKDSSRSTGCSSYCKVCQKDYKADWEQKNRTRQNEKWNERRRRNLAELSVYKARLGCAYCPENDPICLQFHHRDPSEKKYHISDAAKVKAMETVWLEVAKCDVICANCHLKHHYGKIG